jgi:hypothetical protein
MRQLTVTVPGGRLSVIDEGDGPPILLLHAGIVDARAWDPLVPHLVAAGYRAIRFDARGYGQSETDDVPERSGGAHAGRSPSRRTRGSGVRRRAERRPGATAGPVRLIQSRLGPDVDEYRGCRFLPRQNCGSPVVEERFVGNHDQVGRLDEAALENRRLVDPGKGRHRRPAALRLPLS